MPCQNLRFSVFIGIYMGSLARGSPGISGHRPVEARRNPGLGAAWPTGAVLDPLFSLSSRFTS